MRSSTERSPTVTIATTNFDYGLIDTDAKGKLIWFANQIQKEGAKHISSGLEIGRMLSEARDLLGADQSFQAWVERECGYSSRTAYRYIAAFEHFGDCDNLSHIELSAMYELTKSDSAKKKALKLADKGVRVTHAMAKQLVSDSAPKHQPSEAKQATPPAPSVPDETVEEAKRQESPLPEEKAAQEKPDAAPSADREATDFGRCPNCASTKWTEDASGVACAKCHHPHGEPSGGADDDRIGIQKSKTRKTAESLMRAFDDLNFLSPSNKHADAIAKCKQLLNAIKVW